MAKASKEEQRKTPILRFKGFTDDWEQRKLENIFFKIRNAFVGKVTDYYVDKGFIYLESNNIKNGKINLVTKRYINSEFYYQQKEKWLHTNDIVMVQSGDVGQTAVISSNFNNTAAHALIMFQGIDQNVNPYFLNYQFQSYKSINQIQIISKGNTVKHVLASDMKKFIIMLSSFNEQNNIANFLKKLDDILALYERKLKLLSQVKKYFLDNLFAEKEYPNLRFKGFTDAWEQRKLLKVCKKEDNKRIPIKEQERKEGDTPYFGANGIQGYIDGYTHDGTNILIAEDGANNVKNYPIKLITGKIWVNNHAHVLNVNTKINNGNFLVGAIKKINFYRYLVGSSRYKLTAESLNQVKIKIAKQSEQGKIGELLKDIEELLTLYEDKQQHIIEIKNTLLNTMFI